MSESSVIDEMFLRMLLRQFLILICVLLIDLTRVASARFLACHSKHAMNFHHTEMLGIPNVVYLLRVATVESFILLNLFENIFLFLSINKSSLRQCCDI